MIGGTVWSVQEVIDSCGGAPGCAAAPAGGTALVAGCISESNQVGGLSVHTNFGPAFWSKYIRAFSAKAASAHVRYGSVH